MKRLMRLCLSISFVVLLGSFSLPKEKPDESSWIKEIINNLDVTEYFITFDQDKNLVITGYFVNSARFGNKKIVAMGNYDIFIAKYSRDGKLLWLQQAGSDQLDMAQFVKTDNVGNIYITGYISGVALFNEYVVTPKGMYNIFTAKYDPEGKLQWVKCKGAEVICETNSLKHNRKFRY
jgi:hypothetical protein